MKKRTRNQQNNSEKGRKELGINKITWGKGKKNISLSFILIYGDRKLTGEVFLFFVYTKYYFILPNYYFVFANYYFVFN